MGPAKYEVLLKNILIVGEMDGSYYEDKNTLAF